MPEKFHLNSVFPFSAKATTTTEYINPKGIADVSSVSCCERKWIYESNRMFSTKMKEIRKFSLEKLEIRNLRFDHFINDDERKKERNKPRDKLQCIYKFVPFIFVYKLNLFVLLGAFSTDIIRWTQLRTLYQPCLSNVELSLCKYRLKYDVYPSHIYI